MGGATPGLIVTGIIRKDKETMRSKKASSSYSTLALPIDSRPVYALTLTAFNGLIIYGSV